MIVWNRRTHKKRRIRKKWRLGEFVELGFNFRGKAQVDDPEAFMDSFIDYAEANDLSVAMGFHFTSSQEFFGIVTGWDSKKNRPRSLTEDDRERFIGALSLGVERLSAGPLVDSWRDV